MYTIVVKIIRQFNYSSIFYIWETFQTSLKLYINKLNVIIIILIFMLYIKIFIYYCYGCHSSETFTDFNEI